MLFDSTAYVIFLIVVVALYWRLKFRAQNYFLLAASYFFYGWWDWRFLFLMAGSTIVDFVIARGIRSELDVTRRKRLLILSLLVNFTVLGFFKYFNFFVDSFVQIAPLLQLDLIPKSLWEIILPPAISFYTFQEVAYIVDVYHRKLEPADSLVDYALFVSLFPHLIAGPIQQPSHLLPQVQKARAWKPEGAFDGIMLILEGLFRKVVIADNCALVAEAAFGGSLGGQNIATLTIGTVAFAWQIYGDFSGYSSIARGSAQLLGFHFMVNFRQPYLAESLQDFWRRWHISLSTWLRDYLYIPLGGNRMGSRRQYANLIITMLLGGLWHGANWTFVVWGAMHGVGLAVERLIVGKLKAPPVQGFVARWARRVAVFTFVCAAWVMFRSTSIEEAWQQFQSALVWQWLPVYGVAFQFLAVYSLMLLFVDLRLEASGSEYLFERRPYWVRIVVGMIFAILISLGGANRQNAFIYFQF